MVDLPITTLFLNKQSATHRHYPSSTLDPIRRNSRRRGPKEEAGKDGVRRVRVAPDADPFRRPVLRVLQHGEAEGPRRRPGPRVAGGHGRQRHSPGDAAAARPAGRHGRAASGISSAPAAVLPFSYSSES